MVRLAGEFPGVHQNFNLVPSLITQIQDYVSGIAHDPFLALVSKPAGELTGAERRFALHYLFQANPVNMIGRYPRYRELWERFRATADRPEGAEPYFVTRDYADLQVLSQLAWFDEYFLTDPEVAYLIRKQADYTREDQIAVIAKQREILAQVVPAYAEAAQRGSVELSTTPFYHPILPLLCDTNSGAESTPGLPLPTRRFRRPDDASHQVARAIELHERAFGSRPRGLWPSEGSVSEEVLALVHRQGIEWMATAPSSSTTSTASRKATPAWTSSSGITRCRTWWVLCIPGCRQPMLPITCCIPSANRRARCSIADAMP